MAKENLFEDTIFKLIQLLKKASNDFIEEKTGKTKCHKNKSNNIGQLDHSLTMVTNQLIIELDKSNRMQEKELIEQVGKSIKLILNHLYSEENKSNSNKQENNKEIKIEDEKNKKRFSGKSNIENKLWGANALFPSDKTETESGKNSVKIAPEQTKIEARKLLKQFELNPLQFESEFLGTKNPFLLMELSQMLADKIIDEFAETASDLKRITDANSNLGEQGDYTSSLFLVSGIRDQLREFSMKIGAQISKLSPEFFTQAVLEMETAILKDIDTRLKITVVPFVKQRLTDMTNQKIDGGFSKINNDSIQKKISYFSATENRTIEFAFADETEKIQQKFSEYEIVIRDCKNKIAWFEENLSSINNSLLPMQNTRGKLTELLVKDQVGNNSKNIEFAKTKNSTNFKIPNEIKNPFEEIKNILHDYSFIIHKIVKKLQADFLNINPPNDQMKEYLKSLKNYFHEIIENKSKKIAKNKYAIPLMKTMDLSSDYMFKMISQAEIGSMLSIDRFDIDKCVSVLVQQASNASSTQTAEKGVNFNLRKFKQSWQEDDSAFLKIKTVFRKLIQKSKQTKNESNYFKPQEYEKKLASKKVFKPISTLKLMPNNNLRLTDSKFDLKEPHLDQIKGFKNSDSNLDFTKNNENHKSQFGQIKKNISKVPKNSSIDLINNINGVNSLFKSSFSTFKKLDGEKLDGKSGNSSKNFNNEAIPYKNLKYEDVPALKYKSSPYNSSLNFIISNDLNSKELFKINEAEKYQDNEKGLFVGKPDLQNFEEPNQQTNKVSEKNYFQKHFSQIKNLVNEFIFLLQKHKQPEIKSKDNLSRKFKAVQTILETKFKTEQLQFLQESLEKIFIDFPENSENNLRDFQKTQKEFKNDYKFENIQNDFQKEKIHYNSKMPTLQLKNLKKGEILKLMRNLDFKTNSMLNRYTAISLPINCLRKTDFQKSLKITGLSQI